jgi:surfeit locus 1 family protein
MSSPVKRRAMMAITSACIVLFTALGIWQVERRAEKLELIEAVASRVHARPGAPPLPRSWPRFDPRREVYRHVTVRGTLREEQATLVQALTDLGAGFWVLVPVADTRGFTVIVNRGFVPDRAHALALCGDAGKVVTITGLLRVSERGGGFLRANRPEEDRWYSRDVAAIATARGLGPVAPYFIDADGSPNPGGWPRGGLTQLQFPNNHLLYALTWFGLALISFAALLTLLRSWRPTGGKPLDEK